MPARVCASIRSTWTQLKHQTNQNKNTHETQTFDGTFYVIPVASGISEYKSQFEWSMKCVIAAQLSKVFILFRISSFHFQFLSVNFCALDSYREENWRNCVYAIGNKWHFTVSPMSLALIYQHFFFLSSFQLHCSRFFYWRDLQATKNI